MAANISSKRMPCQIKAFNISYSNSPFFNKIYEVLISFISGLGSELGPAAGAHADDVDQVEVVPLREGLQDLVEDQP